MNSKSAVWEQDSARTTFSVGAPTVPVHSNRQEGTVGIDLRELLARCLEDATFCTVILHKFAMRSADQVSALERALEAGNMVELAREAHTLQGVAANLSASGLRDRAEVLETAALENDQPRARQALAATRSEIERCTALVPELIAQLA